ncbi:MAG TPA: YceI family protein [Puia sp.]|nr:YceI family protein [Puia sp.]
MKNILAATVALLAGQFATGQLKPQNQGSAVSFTIRNFGIGIQGNLTGLLGNVDFNPQHPETAHFDVSVDASTVNTDNSLRDSHLRNDDYFDVRNYPRIRLVSTGIRATGKPGMYLFTGQLTIKDVTRPISFPFTVKPAGSGLNFAGSFDIRRKDFHVGGTSTISDELTVTLNVLAVK